MKKPTRKTLIRNLDKVVSQIVRKRQPYCVVCGSREKLTCGHLFSRTNYSTRWDLGNCFTQCLSCNLRHEYSPAPFTIWYIKKYGMEEYEELNQQHTTARKWKDYELKELLEKYKSMLKEL